MKIAVVGAGISGLAAAYLLQREHDVTVFEAAEHIGGHTRTENVELDGKTFAVDTGFVVYNEATYPNFVRLLEQLGVPSQPTAMSFSVQCAASGLEYCGTSLNTLFAQRRNLINLTFYRLLLDIMRFNRAASTAARRGTTETTLAGYLDRTLPSERVRRNYLIPLVSAIWSLSPDRFDDFPAEFFLRFSERHRLLQVRDQLPWRVVSGGAREYVRALTARLRREVLTSTPIRTIRRLSDEVELELGDGERRRFDHVVVGVHADQALRLLDDPSDDEREILGRIRYQDNKALLHTDASMLPRNRRAWANWNYRIPAGEGGKPVTTYNMSGLQGLESSTPICVTLNDQGVVDPSRVVREIDFAHPVYTTRTIEAQKSRERIDGVRRTHYCGAYWGYGFHEDGLVSALGVCERFGQRL